MLIFTFITKHQNSQCNYIICLPTHALYYTFATCNSTISLVVILHVYTACWVIWPTTIMYQSRPYIFVMQYDSQVYNFIHQLNPIIILPIWKNLISRLLPFTDMSLSGRSEDKSLRYDEKSFEVSTKQYCATS